MKSMIKKVLQIVSSCMSIIVAIISLVLTILALSGMDRINNNSLAVWIILIFGNFLLFALGIYLSFSFLKNYNIKIKNEEYKSVAEGCKLSQRIILENQKQILTNYKELTDRMKQKYQKYKQKIEKASIELDELTKNGFICNKKESDWDKYKENQFELIKKAEIEHFTEDLVDNYQRLLGNVTILLKRSVEEYLRIKGCKENVSVAVKQLNRSILYSQLRESIYCGDNTINVYTAFRDSRTYFNKKRQETWKAIYKIHNNSAFLNSIDTGYYIFNFFDKSIIKDGVYKNENIIFYDHYNCGITSSIYSCINGERKLFGYLACDSLVNYKKKSKKIQVYDWNTATMTMHAANIIALYLQEFEEIWNQVHPDENFCEHMVNKIKMTRYEI